MADTKQILHHIAELYAKPRVNQEISDAIFEMEEKLNAHFDDYQKAFDGKFTDRIIKAIDDYWRFKSDKTRPTVAQILAMENSDEKPKEEEDQTYVMHNHVGLFTAPAEQLMQEDIKFGNCKHLLNVYKMAVDYVLTDKLIDMVGITEWRNMDYSKRYQTAKKNGLFDGFDETLRFVCLNAFGKETQFQSENELNNASAHYQVGDFSGNLAAHWRMD